MKPKFRCFAKVAFPALIMVPALLQVAHAISPANFINPDAAGNVLVAGDFDELNGSDWTVNASGGTTSPFSVTIQSGVLLTGQIDTGNGVVVSSDHYTIKNSGDLDVVRYGIISRAGDTVIENETGGVIQADIDGIRFELDPENTELSTRAVINYGLIDAGEIGINAESGPGLSMTNFGVITGGEAAISMGGGHNVVDLGFGSSVNGDILTGVGINEINFTSGADSIFHDQNIVHGNILGVDVITKSGTGYAFIGGPGESFDVSADSISISSGGLVINGDLFSQTEGRTQVDVTGNSQIDGTGSWNADILIASGGISAGATPDQLNETSDVILDAAGRAFMDDVANYSVGSLSLNGNFATYIPSVDSSLLSPPFTIPGYIRVDVNPQTEIIAGVNNDIIYHGGAGNTFDLTGVAIQLSPTDLNKTMTEGTYTIVDSENPLIGVEAMGPIGVHFSSTAPDFGPFYATEGGENSLDTVLTNYFTTVSTEDPVVLIDSGAAAAVIDSNNSNLVVTIQHDFGSLPGLTHNQAALGDVIDSLVNSPNPIIQDFIAALDYSDLEGVQATLATLDPGATMGMASSVINSNYRLHRLTQEHLAQVRGIGRQESETSPSTRDSKGVITPGQTRVYSTGRGNAWGTFSYDSQDNSGSDANGDFDGDVGAFTAGFDWLLAPELVLGIVLDGSKGDFDADQFSSDLDSFRGAVYATWGGSMGFYSDALVGFGTHSLDSSLGANGVLVDETSNDTDADSFQALWTFGFTMGDEKVKHGPFVGFEYQKLSVDGYTQGGPLFIDVDSYDVESLRGLIGYRVNANFGTFRPYASVAYAHEFEDGSNGTTATLEGLPFHVTGADQSSAIIVTAGTGILLTEAMTLDIGYRGDIATDDGITSHGGSIGLNYSF